MAASSSSGSLNARLTLTGSDDVKRQLEDVGNVGEKSLGRISAAGHGADGLDGIEHAAEGIAQAFEGLSNFTTLGGVAGIFEGIAGSVGRFNVVLGAGLAVISGASAGLFELAEHGAKFASEIKDGATRVGVASKDYASLRFAFEQSAASAEDFEKAMGVILEASQQADEAGNNAIKAAQKIVDSDDRIRKSAEATQDIYKKRTDTLKENAIRVADDLSEINLRYSRAREAAAKLDGQKETDARKKADDDRMEEMRLLNKRIAEETRLANKAQKDELDRAKLEKKRADEKALADYNKAVIEAADNATGAAKKLADLGIAIKDSGDKARDPAEVFRDIADKIGEIEDPATKAAKAIDIFGRRFGTKLVEALSEGRDALKKLEEEAKDLNIIPDPKELTVGKKFDDEIAKLGSVIKAASGRLGLTLAPLFGSVVDAAATALGHAIPGLIAFGNKIADILKPVFDDLANAILGDTDKIKSQFIFVLVRDAQLLAQAFVVAAEVIGSVIGGLVTVFNQVDSVVQSVFGGASLGGIAAFLLSIRGALAVVSLLDLALSTLVTGPLALLATAIAPIVTGMLAIGAAIGWPFVLIAGLVALIATLLLAGDGWKNFKTGVELTARVIAAFITYLTDPFVSAFDAANQATKKFGDWLAYWVQYGVGLAGQAVDWLFGKIKAVADAIASLLGAGASVIGSGDTSTPFHPVNVTGAADGGLQQGPGSGTSDSLLRMLSDGEYVVKARAVRYWGLSTLHAINNMLSPKGYAAGGYVDSLGGAMAPATRAGGLGVYQAAAAIEGRVSVDLSHNGSTFRGLLAPAAVAASMVRYASAQQRVSLGRRSTAYGAA